jgi:hypothetical protein
VAYTENTAGIIAAINACILAQGGTVTSYPSNTGGVIKALIALEAAIAGGGGGGGSGSAVSIPFTAGEILIKGDAVYLSTADGKVYRAQKDATREQATVIGLATANAALDAEVNVIVRGRSYAREIGWSRVSLLCNFDIDNSDVSEIDHALPTNTNTTSDTSIKKFGYGSARFDGTAELVWASDSSLELDGDFTIEFWLYLDALPGVHGMVPIAKRDLNGTAPGTWGIKVLPSSGSSSDIEWWDFHLSGGANYLMGQVTAATWHHIAISRTGLIQNFYVDGVQGAAIQTAVDYTNTNYPLRLGRWVTSFQEGLVGNIDELRITKGVGRYTGAFTPPAAPFTAGTDFTVGTEYFLDSLTGHITSVPASTSGDYLTAIGEAISTTQLDTHLQVPVERT